jgi:hypothetical protein
MNDGYFGFWGPRKRPSNQVLQAMRYRARLNFRVGHQNEQ